MKPGPETHPARRRFASLAGRKTVPGRNDKTRRRATGRDPIAAAPRARIRSTVPTRRGSREPLPRAYLGASVVDRWHH